MPFACAQGWSEESKLFSGFRKGATSWSSFCFNEAFSDNLSLNSIPLLVSVLRPGVGFFLFFFLNGRFNHLYLKNNNKIRVLNSQQFHPGCFLDTQVCPWRTKTMTFPYHLTYYYYKILIRAVLIFSRRSEKHPGRSAHTDVLSCFP